MHRLELSPHMAAQLKVKPGADAVPVTIGDMTATRVPGAPFSLVYLVANTIMNVTGFRLRDRWAGWDRAPFTSDSQSQVAVFERLA